MRHDVEHLRGLVDDLFLLARIEAGELTLEHQHVDLAELADETIEAMPPVARRHHVELRLDATGAVPVLGGPGPLGRVMCNLVDNAIRHAPAASHVVIRVVNGDGGDQRRRHLRDLAHRAAAQDPARLQRLLQDQ